MDAAHDAQHFLSSAVCSAACFAAKTRDFLVDIAKVSIKFGANFVRDTRRAPARAEITGGCRTGFKTSKMLLRTSAACCAHVSRQNCAVFRSKLARFCAQFFQNQRDGGRRRIGTPRKTQKASLNGRFTRYAACSKLCGLFFRMFCVKNSLFVG